MLFKQKRACLLRQRAVSGCCLLRKGLWVKYKMADEMETGDSKASAKVKLAKLFTSEGNLDRSFTLKEFMEYTGMSSGKVNVALFSLVQQGVVEQTSDSPPAWSLSSSPRLSQNPSIETRRSEGMCNKDKRCNEIVHYT